MRATLTRRIAGVAGSLVLFGTLMLAGAGGVLASPPNWVMDVTALPSTVAPGSNAGFSVTITNNGPSNISSLYLVTKTTASPVYVDDSLGRDGCSAQNSGPLKCTFGALNNGEHVTVIVAYVAPGSGSSFDPGFEGNTTGQAFTDPQRSHGDALIDLDFTGTNLRADKNFGGKFSVAPGESVSDSAQLTGNNRQATGVSNLPAAVGATVLDGPDVTANCVTDSTIDCSKTFGEWSEVHVGNGGPYTSPILVQITFKTGTPTAFVHVFDGGTSQERVGPCPTTGFDGVHTCFTWSGSTATIVTLYNGSYKGL